MIVEQEKRRIRYYSLALLVLIVTGLIVMLATKPIYSWLEGHFLSNIPTLVVSYKTVRVNNMFLIAGWLSGLFFIPSMLGLYWANHLEEWIHYRINVWGFYLIDCLILIFMPLLFTALFSHEWLHLITHDGQHYLSYDYLLLFRQVLKTHYYYFVIALVPLCVHSFFFLSDIVVPRHLLFYGGLAFIGLLIIGTFVILPPFYHYDFFYLSMLVAILLYTISSSRRIVILKLVSNNRKKRDFLGNEILETDWESAP